MFKENFVLLDTEYTADEDSRTRGWVGEHKEVIQIGVIDVQGSDVRPLQEYVTHVKPVLNPILSEFIKELTGITQGDVEHGLSLAAALREINTRFPTGPVYSWGDDGDVILKNCELLNISCPIASERFINLRDTLTPIFHSIGVDPKKYSSGRLVEAFGIPGKRAHDALNDMQNFRLVLQELRKRDLI
jgi:ERI1 exoribonuclease 2